MQMDMGTMKSVFRLQPWLPMLCTCIGRISLFLSVACWFDRQAVGLASEAVRSVFFYGALSFVGCNLLRIVVSGLLAGPTPDLKVNAEAGSFREDSVAWIASGMRGWRPEMEDAHVVQMLDNAVFPDVALFAVLDGHGGKDVSMLASQLLAEEVEAVGRELIADTEEPPADGGDNTNGGSTTLEKRTRMLEEALEQALPRLDAKLRAGPMGLARLLPASFHPFSTVGSTACVAAVDFESREVIVANIGDSRAFLIDSGKALALSEDHKPEDPKERTRIRNAGGRVVRVGPCYRVDGNLNLSRAFGDFRLKANAMLPPDKQKVSACPDLQRRPFKGGSQELLVVACDGLFERFSNQDIADFVWPRLKEDVELKQIAEELLRHCCARGYRGQPIEMGTDNETVVLVRLPPKVAS